MDHIATSAAGGVWCAGGDAGRYRVSHFLVMLLPWECRERVLVYCLRYRPGVHRLVLLPARCGGFQPSSMQSVGHRRAGVTSLCWVPPQFSDALEKAFRLTASGAAHTISAMPHKPTNDAL